MGFVWFAAMVSAKGVPMDLAVVAVLLLVVGVIAVVISVLFELSPFAHHAETFRDRATGRRLFESPHLETRDEFEHRTQAR